MNSCRASVLHDSEYGVAEMDHCKNIGLFVRQIAAFELWNATLRIKLQLFTKLH